MKNIIFNVAKDFDMKKGYKIFRMFQKIANPVLSKKKDYQDFNINLDDRIVPIRIFNPFDDDKKHKVIIFIHGGGWI
jgi:acetyl esterase/lipase